MRTDLAQFPEWHIFRPEHCVVLALTTVITIWMILAVRRHPGSGKPRIHSIGLAIVLLLTYPVKLIGYSLADYEFPLPMHLCDWAAHAGALALLTGKRWLAELTWFWGISATLQGLITPALEFGFPHPVFFTHGHLHISVVVAAFYIVFGLRAYPRRYSVWRALAATHVYLVVAFLANLVTGHNYGFLREKPPTGSLMTILPPEPWHILALEPVVLLLFGLLYAPFWLRERLQSKIPQTS